MYHMEYAYCCGMLMSKEILFAKRIRCPKCNCLLKFVKVGISECTPLSEIYYVDRNKELALIDPEHDEYKEVMDQGIFDQVIRNDLAYYIGTENT